MPITHIIFVLLTLVAVPAAASFGVRHRWAERGLVCILFLSTAYHFDINFESMEMYRGDTRGFEWGVTEWMVVALTITMLRSPRWAGKRLDVLPPNGIALLVYAFLALSSVFVAYVPIYAGFGLLKLLRGLALYWLAYNYVRSEDDLREFVLVVVGMIALQFLLVMWQRKMGIYRAVGSTPHPNTLAVYINMMNMVLYAFVMGEKKTSRYTWAAWAGLAMGVLIVLATFSRGALLSLGVGMMIVTALSIWTKPRATKFKIIGALALAALPAAIKFAPAIIKRFATAPKESGISRQQAQNAAMEMAHNHAFGVGLNNYSFVINNTGYSRFIPLEVDRGVVHNIYLLNASELGWLGLGAFLVVIVGFLFLGAKYIRRREDDVTSSLAIGITVAMITLWFQSLLEWLFRQTMVTMEFFLLAGVLAALPRVARQIRDERLKLVALLMHRRRGTSG
jgi:hypothetical protein